MVDEVTSRSQSLSAPSVTAINTLSNSRSQKAKSTSTASKRHWDALDDGDKARSTTACSSFLGTSSDVPTPSAPPSKSSNVASMVTLTGAIASLGTSINHQTMTSDIQIANRVQGFINSQNYLSDLEKLLAGEYYVTQPTLTSGLLSMTASVAKITLRWI